MKLYLDADVFIALIAEKDHLKPAAERFIKTEAKKHELYTSQATIIEVWHVMRRNQRSAEVLQAVSSIEQIVKEVLPLETDKLKEAIALANEYDLTPMDAVHIIYAKNLDAIVSSDQRFDRVPELKKIDYSAYSKMQK